MSQYYYHDEFEYIYIINFTLLLALYPYYDDCYDHDDWHSCDDHVDDEGCPTTKLNWIKSATWSSRKVTDQSPVNQRQVCCDTLQGTNISPKNGILKMIFLFPRWDMLIPRRVLILSFFVWQMRDIFHIFMLNFANKYRWNIHTIRPIPSFISTSPATLIFSHQFFWGLPCWRWLCHSFR